MTSSTDIQAHCTHVSEPPCTPVVICCGSDCELLVTVQGPRPENILFLVHEVFEGLISESFQGVTYDYMLPCPDCQKFVSTTNI